MCQTAESGYRYGMALFLVCFAISTQRLMAQDRPQDERAPSVFSEYGASYKDVTKLVRTQDDVAVAKQLARWAKSSDNAKDQGKLRTATTLVVCSWSIPRMQSLIDRNLLNDWEAAKSSVLCLRPDAAMTVINAAVKKQGSTVSYSDVLMWQVSREDWLVGESSLSLSESLVAAGADPSHQETLTDFAPRASFTFNGVTRQEKDIVYTEGPTPLYYAILHGNSSGVHFLLKHGADKTRRFRVAEGKIPGYTGLGPAFDWEVSRTKYVLRTPAEFACSGSNAEICAMLK
jgi:hypothetical protein